MNYFGNFHPAVIFVYFIAVLVLNMTVFDPFLILISLLGQLVFYLYLKGGREGAGFVWKCLILLPICGGINMLINHRGVSVLFYMAGLPVTKECLFYGSMTGGLLALSLLLFGCYNHLMTSGSTHVSVWKPFSICLSYFFHGIAAGSQNKERLQENKGNA